MVVADGDVKIYRSDVNGNIDLTNEWTENEGLFAPVLDVDNDVQVKLWVKNTHATDQCTRNKLWTVNGGVYNNTNGTPLFGMKLFSHITPGTYNLTFPTPTSVIVTPPSGISLPAVTIAANSSTYYSIPLLTNTPALLCFTTGLQAGNTANIVISDGGEYLQLAVDSGGSPGTYAKRTSYAAGLDIGTLTAGATYAFWIKQVIPDGTTAVGNDRRYRMPVKGANQ